MENDDKQCMLVWGQGKYTKSIPFNKSSNVPILYSAASALAYRTFATTFKAMEANYYRREHVLRIPGMLRTERDAPDECEFIAKENINLGTQDGDKTGEIVRPDDATIKTSNGATLKLRI